MSNQLVKQLTQRIIDESINKPFNDYFEVAPDVWGMRDVLVNIYMIQDKESGDWVLVDAGLKNSASKIKKLAIQLFGKKPPSAIILTHGHFDHIGSLETLATEWNIPVYAHVLEMPYLTGRSAYPPPDPTVGGGLMSCLSFLYPNNPANLGSMIYALPEDGKLPVLKDWQFLHTPGHAPGHISLFREEDRVLIAGDAFVTTRQESAISVFFQVKIISGPPAYFTYDWGQASDSVRKLLYLSPEIVATGHGRPMKGETMRESLRKMHRDFYDKTVPSYGRYVNHPAIVNTEGVLTLPPAPPNPYTKWFIAGTVVAGVFSFYWFYGRKKPSFYKL